MLATREHTKIIDDERHPRSKYIPDTVTKKYDLRTLSTFPQYFSRTKRHKLSFNPRAIIDKILIYFNI